MIRIVPRCMNVTAALCLVAATALAQTPSFVGTWHGQSTLTAPGGYQVVTQIEDVFQPDGRFSSMSTSAYGNGAVAGGPIGAVRGTGTYTVNSAQSTIEFHVAEYTSTQPSTVQAPYVTAEHFQFLSPTTYTRQSLAGGPVITYQKVQ
jgi:hypothetical protein